MIIGTGKGSGPVIRSVLPFRYQNSALIAQGIEQRFPKPCVGCSNHLRGAIKKHLRMQVLFICSLILHGFLRDF